MMCAFNVILLSRQQASTRKRQRSPIWAVIAKFQPYTS